MPRAQLSQEECRRLPRNWVITRDAEIKILLKMRRGYQEPDSESRSSASTDSLIGGIRSTHTTQTHVERLSAGLWNASSTKLQAVWRSHQERSLIRMLHYRRTRYALHSLCCGSHVRLYFCRVISSFLSGIEYGD